jgi:hypothetical protein
MEAWIRRRMIDLPGQPAMIQTGAIGLCAARECHPAADMLEGLMESAGVRLSSPSGETGYRALVLLISPQTSFDALRVPILSAGVRRVPMIVIKMAPVEFPEEVRYSLEGATVIVAASGIGNEVAGELVRALLRCEALIEQGPSPIRPLP